MVSDAVAVRPLVLICQMYLTPVKQRSTISDK